MSDEGLLDGVELLRRRVGDEGSDELLVRHAHPRSQFGTLCYIASVITGPGKIASHVIPCNAYALAVAFVSTFSECLPTK